MILRRISGMLPTNLKNRLSVSLIAAACLYLLIIPAFILERASKSNVKALKAKNSELAVLTSEYKTLKERIDAVEQRRPFKKVNEVTQALDDTLSSLNLKGKLKSVKTAGRREVKGATEDTAEVALEKLNMNELVNLFYKLEDVPMMLSVKRVDVRKSFENPELLNISMTLSLFIEK